MSQTSFFPAVALNKCFNLAISLFTIRQSAYQSPTHNNLLFHYIAIYLTCHSPILTLLQPSALKHILSHLHPDISLMLHTILPWPLALFLHKYQIILPEQLCSHGSYYLISVSSRSPHTTSPLLNEEPSSAKKQADTQPPVIPCSSPLHSLAPPTVPSSPC